MHAAWMAKMSSITVARLFVGRQSVAGVAGTLDGVARVHAPLTARVVQATPSKPDNQNLNCLYYTVGLNSQKI
jgi:hypothetical protein